jgi:hypothetical protein
MIRAAADSLQHPGGDEVMVEEAGMSITPETP